MEENKTESTETKERPKGLFRKIFCKRNRLIVLFSFMGFLLVLTVVPGGKEFVRNTLWSMLPTDASFVNLPSDPYEMGKKQGQEFKYSIKLLCGIYVENLICENDDSLKDKHCEKAEKLFKDLDARWNDEIAGLSEASGVEERVLRLGNSFLDLGLYKGGCRQVTVYNKDQNRLLHAHNMDWDNLGGVGNLMVTVFRTEAGEGRNATVHIGFPGMTGALAVINEKGISLAFNQVGISKGDCLGMPVFLKLRDIAERCSSFEDAEKEILDMKKGMPFSIMLSDAKSFETAVYERSSDKEIRKRHSSNGIITSDNISWCGVGMETCSVDLVARKAGMLENENQMEQLEKLKTVLRHKNVLLGCNIYSIIFDHNNNAFYLASGNIPAASGEYVKHKLFEK